MPQQTTPLSEVEEAYLAEHRFPDPAPEPEALVQDPLPGMEAG